MPIDYLVQQEDGVSKFTLQEGDGFLILQESEVTEPPVENENIYIPTLRRRRR